MGELSGLEGAELRAAMDRALATVGMAQNGAKPFHEMSKGMRQRMRLAQALLHDPEFLLLDEPFNGMDPEARLLLMEVLRGLAAKGRRILVSSHILGEVAHLTDRILLLFRGRLLAEGSVPEIRALAGPPILVELRIGAESSQAVARWAVEQEELVALRMEEGGAVLAVRNPPLLPAQAPGGGAGGRPAPPFSRSPGSQSGGRVPVPHQGSRMMPTPARTHLGPFPGLLPSRPPGPRLGLRPRPPAAGLPQLRAGHPPPHAASEFRIGGGSHGLP